MIEELPNFRARAEYNRSKQDKNLRTVKGKLWQGKSQTCMGINLR